MDVRITLLAALCSSRQAEITDALVVMDGVVRKDWRAAVVDDRTSPTQG